jgi:hypothetical protein
LPTTYPRRMKKIIPMMVRKLGVNTPAKVPIVPVGTLFLCFDFCGLSILFF